MRLLDHARELEARIGEILHPCRAQVAAGTTRVLDDDGIRHAAAAQPLAHRHGDAARVGEDGDEPDAGVVRRELRQVARQPRAHHEGLCAALAGLAHVRGVFGDRAHDVDRDHAAPAGDRERRAHLAVQRGEVGAVDRRLVPAAVGGGHQVGMEAAQIDRREGFRRAVRPDGAGQAMGGHAHAHAALHDGQQIAAEQSKRRQGFLRSQ